MGVAVNSLGEQGVALGTAIVVDEDNLVLGTIDRSEAALAATGLTAEAFARPVVPIRESATLAVAVARMVKERRRTLPVVDDAGRAVGLISDIDALRWVARRNSSR
jgi:CBS-domain-containing membrane protein